MKDNKINLIIIPMAGLGKRFRKENFNTIKPLILVDKDTILEKSVKDLPEAKQKFIILNEKVFDKRLVQKILSKNSFEPILLKKKTLGQADTINKLYNKKFIGKEDCLVHSCDYILKYNKKKFLKFRKKCDVVIFVTKLKYKVINDYKSFAYCIVDKNNNVKSISEKKIISDQPYNDNIIVGTFWFKKLNDCFMSQEISLKKNDKINKEYYIGNNINHLIKLKKKIKIFEVDYWLNLGDIFSFNEYIYWKNFFDENEDLKLC